MKWHLLDDEHSDVGKTDDDSWKWDVEWFTGYGCGGGGVGPSIFNFGTQANSVFQLCLLGGF